MQSRAAEGFGSSLPQVAGGSAAALALAADFAGCLPEDLAGGFAFGFGFSSPPAITIAH